MLQAMTNATGLVSDNMGRVYTAGYNGYGEIGDNSNTQSTVLVGISHTSLAVEETTIKMDVGETKEIKAHMELGFNLLYKTLENETYTYKSVNEKIATVDDRGVVTGVKYGKTSIIITNKETGERGIVVVNIVREGSLTNPKVVSGSDFSAALKADGTVWTWGYNGYGQLGHGDKTRRIEPEKVDIEGIIDIAAGTNHLLFLKQDGTVWGVGLNTNGQLGDYSTSNKLTPVQTADIKDIIQIEAGNAHSVALKSDGTVYAWGYNGYGNLGDATTTRRTYPVEVRYLSGVKDIAAGHHSSMAVDMDGKVYAWGYNGYGNLGDGTKTTRLTISETQGLPPISEVDLGVNFSAAVSENGEVYTWGYNGYGNLGDGTKTLRINPVKPVFADGTTLKGIESISCRS